jgi:glutamate synthase domain-containing protein 3
MVINFLNGVAHEAREIMASLGVRTLDELIGRPEFLRQREVPGHPKANLIDLGAVLKDVIPDLAKHHGVAPESLSRICTQDRNDGISKTPLDLQILRDLATALGTGEISGDTPEYGPLSTPDAITAAIQVLPDRQPVELSYDVVNTDRNIGTRLSGRIAEIHGDRGFNGHTAVTLKLRGSAGQSLGTFLVSGVKIELTGEANDYTGKGMAAGEIVVKVSPDAKFNPATNTILGNTSLYGATGGYLYGNGRAGERFAVRNSGATAVVEGVGDHGCEYMTNGTVAILGKTGKNFGAGMSGGTAYVYDIDGLFEKRLNKEMVNLYRLIECADKDLALVKSTIEQHVAHTASPRGQFLLENWDAELPKFFKVLPRDYERMLEAFKKVEEQGLTGDEAAMAAFEANLKDLARVGGN